MLINKLKQSGLIVHISRYSALHAEHSRKVPCVLQSSCFGGLNVLQCGVVLISVTSASSVEVSASVAVKDMDLVCLAVASSALHIPSAVVSVRFSVFSERDIVLLLTNPHTILSLIRLSVRSPNLQVLAFSIRSVAYLSTLSLSLLVSGVKQVVLDTWCSHVTFFFVDNEHS